MQLLPTTAHEVARGTGLASDETALHHPEVNVPLGAKLLSALRRSFAANPALAIAAYNSGSGAVRRWLDARGGEELDVFVEQIPYDETRGYVKRVLASQAAYAFLYARPVLDEVLALPARARGGG
jgi:soluble lytic murein transglycosylase